MIATLNDAERKFAMYLAKARYQNARSKGIEDQKMGGQSNWQTDLEGVGAEIAFCRLFNLYPDTQTEHIPVYDAYTKSGKSVDVKSTRYQNGHLLAVMGKREKRADIYALMIGAFPEYRFVGVSSGEKLFQEKNIKNFGHGNGYALSQDQLDNWLEEYEMALTDSQEGE